MATAKQRRGDLDKLEKSNPLRPACIFSPDSSSFALVADTPKGPKLTVWDVSSATLLWTKEFRGMWNKGELSQDNHLGFTPDSRLLIGEIASIYEVREARAGQLRPAYKFTADFRFIIGHSVVTRQPSFLKKMLGDWWPMKTKLKTQRLRVVDVATDREVAVLESDTFEAVWLSADGQTMVTKHTDNDRYFLRIWDLPYLPLRPARYLVIGIPLGLGLMVVLIAWWRSRRRPGSKPAGTVGL